MTKDRKHPQSEEKDEQDRNVFTAAADGLIIIDLESGLVIEANPVACAMHAYTHDEFTGLHPERFIHPGSLKTFKKHLQTFQPGNVFAAQVMHMRGDGTTFHAEWRGTEFTYQNRSCLLGIVRDVSERIRSEQQLQKRIRTRTREQSTLLEISHTLASTLELQPELILDQLRGIIQYTNAVLFGLDDSTLTAMAVRVVPVPARGGLRGRWNCPFHSRSTWTVPKPWQHCSMDTDPSVSRIYGAAIPTLSFSTRF